MFKTLRPDITPAQVVGLVVVGIPAVATLLRVFGVYDLTDEQIGSLNDLLQWAGIVAAGLFVSDAGLRSARNVSQAKVDAAAVTAPVEDGDFPLTGIDDEDLPDDEEEFASPPPESRIKPDVPEGEGA
jgi:hypothetical protein